MTRNINVKTRTRTEFVDITPDIRSLVEESGVDNGTCIIYVPHTTAGVTINEGADPSVVKDIQAMLSRLVPHSSGYLHAEGNSDAHIKASLTGSSQTVIIEGGRLVLGTWQAVFFCEFDGPRSRRVTVKITGD